MDFNDLNGIILQISARIFWSLKFLYWVANLAGRYMSVCRYLWQPSEMSVGHTQRLTGQFSMYIKFENVIGLEILSRKLLLPMTYSLTGLKNAKL